MARNRVIYQSEGVYVSKEATSTTSANHAQLSRVQSANYNFNIARQDVNQYGELARIDSIVLESPTVSLDFSYYLTDGDNEAALGFYVATGSQAQSQFPSGQLVDTSGRNFYIVTSREGIDLNYETGDASNGLSGKSCIGIGNAYLTDYSIELAVGSIPTATVSFEGSNMNAFAFSGTNSGNSAAINQELGSALGYSIVLPQPNSYTGANIITALRPGDITVSFGDVFSGSGLVGKIGGEEGVHVQSMSLSLPLGRTPIERLGSKFAFARVVDFPVVSTLTLNGVVNEAATGTNGVARDLVSLVNANPKRDITITIKNPTGGNAVIYTIKNAQLDSASVSSSIGSNKTADFTFTTQIGGVNDKTNGIQMSGSFATAPFQ